MPEIGVTVTHRCGCSRTYPLNMPAAMRESMVAQLREERCGAADCPEREAPRRILAKSATPAVNGKAEP